MIVAHYKKVITGLVLLVVLVVLVLALAACTLLQTSPEKQILTGANSVAASANLTTVLLQRKRITVAQAKDYLAMMRTAGDALDNSHAELLACRARTSSTQHSVPDPCKGNIIADINLATTILGQIEATLREKE